MKTALLLLFIFLSGFALPLGQIPLHVNLEGDNGGALDGTPWHSQTLKEKVRILFYVDPDEKDTNNDLAQALKAEQFNREHYGSVAIINMAATWLPNFAISASLESKQERYPDTLYVKDMNKHLLSQWQLEDDASNVLLFDKKGRLLYQSSGYQDTEAIAKIIALIKENL